MESANEVTLETNGKNVHIMAQQHIPAEEWETSHLLRDLLRLTGSDRFRAFDRLIHVNELFVQTC